MGKQGHLEEDNIGGKIPILVKVGTTYRSKNFKMVKGWVAEPCTLRDVMFFLFCNFAGRVSLSK